jgi:hypothetical protein
VAEIVLSRLRRCCEEKLRHYNKILNIPPLLEESGFVMRTVVYIETQCCPVNWLKKVRKLPESVRMG